METQRTSAIGSAAKLVSGPSAQPAAATSATPTPQTTVSEPVVDVLDQKAKELEAQAQRTPGVRAMLAELEKSDAVKVIQKAITDEAGARGFLDRLLKRDDRGIHVHEGIYLTRVGFRSFRRQDEVSEFRELGNDVLAHVDVEQVRAGLLKILDNLSKTGSIGYITREHLHGLAGVVDDVFRL